MRFIESFSITKYCEFLFYLFFYRWYYFTIWFYKLIVIFNYIIKCFNKLLKIYPSLEYIMFKYNVNHALIHRIIN